ncbi:MAG: signal recognition particle protein [Erysipelotrichia bacterium]|jgi:signal recognition particle subunit SRP54|nr:signal recognition particle protein [Erysipelotrichia bacterium]
MAFESLSDRFARIFKKLRGQSRLSESNMEEMLKEIRIALLEADVNFKVVKDFLTEVRKRAIGAEVLTKLNPSQTIVKIVHDEIEKLLGSSDDQLVYNRNKPTVILLVGLQGSGKTTTAGKLSLMMKSKLNKKVLLAACDTYRPAAIDQLEQIANDIKVDIVSEKEKMNPVAIAKKARTKAYDDHYDVLIIDTAGRLHVDEPLMAELNQIIKEVEPDEVLLAFDAMSGQDVANVAASFNNRLKLTGAVMTKLDGDARGGAALSIRHLTGVAIKFAGTGEKLSDLDVFHPDRMADRILGMGDVVSLVEKVHEELDEREMKKSVNRMLSGKFDLQDMLEQMRQVQKLGSLGGLLSMIPGMPKLTDEQKIQAEKEIANFEAIFNSMTKEERRHPEILRNSRKVRIARGSGKTNADINRVLNKYEKSKEMMRKMGQMQKGNKMPPGGMGGIGGLGF